MHFGHRGNFRQETVARVYARISETVKSSNALDFDDLIMKTVELFQANSDILNEYQERFRYIMVDEYQDTNTAQFKLVSLLAANTVISVWLVMMISRSINSAGQISRIFSDLKKHFRMRR